MNFLNTISNKLVAWLDSYYFKALLLYVVFSGFGYILFGGILKLHPFVQILLTMVSTTIIGFYLLKNEGYIKMEKKV